MEACHGRTDVMERSCATCMARGKDINRTDTCVRWGMAVTYSRYKFVTVPLPERFRNGRFTFEKLLYLELSRSPNGFFLGAPTGS
jgi:hypothetical protein